MRTLDTEIRIDAELTYSVSGRGSECEIEGPSVKIRVRLRDLVMAYEEALRLNVKSSDLVPIEVGPVLTSTEYDGLRGDCAVDASLCAEADPERADD